jgi:hypothetical protein
MFYRRKRPKSSLQTINPNDKNNNKTTTVSTSKKYQNNTTNNNKKVTQTRNQIIKINN